MYSRSPFSFHWLTCALLLLILVAIWIPGLGGSATGLKPSRVTGRVTYQGRPLTTGTLIFMPSDRRGNDWAAAQIESDGRFALSSQQAREELPAGRYSMFFVFRPEDSSATKLQINRRADDEEASDHLADPTPPIPVRYTNPETSGLWIDLAKGPNRIEIDLRD
jgi:hypothetical protein